MDTVAISLDKERQLRYTWGTIRRLKNEHKLVFTDLSDEQLGDFDVIAKLLWAGLVWEEESLTVDAVADMVDMRRTGEVSGLIAEAMGGSTVPPTAATV